MTKTTKKTQAGFDVKRARLEKGMTYTQCAHQIGIAHRTLARFENGGPTLPETAKRIADYWGVSVTDLVPFLRELKK